LSSDDLPAGCTPPIVTMSPTARHRYVARCGCGWTSEISLNAAFAYQAWEEHVGKGEVDA
jgi:hypothetical protein